jgi:hypothetical protein
MIMDAFCLEKDSVFGVSPEVSDGIAAVSSTGKNLEMSAAAVSVRAGFTRLFASCFVANRWPQIYFGAVWQRTSDGTHQDSETALLEDVHVVIVRVPHRPARDMLFGVLMIRVVHKATVAVGPLLKLIQLSFIDVRNVCVVDVPVGRVRVRFLDVKICWQH